MVVNNIYNIDCFEGMAQLPDASVDCILTDLPYGVTAKNKWDKVLPFDKMWSEYERIIKPNGAILLFAQGLFACKLACSNENLFRYDIVWDKVLPTGFANSHKMPMRSDERILVFYKNLPTYNPQMRVGKPCHSRGKAVGKRADDLFNNHNYHDITLVETEGNLKYPLSIWRCQKVHPSKVIHPTQKPVMLLRELIRTYTNENDLVLDTCCGSGSTCVAAYLEDRKYLGFDNGICEKKSSPWNGLPWADVAIERINGAARERKPFERVSKIIKVKRY